MDNERNPRLLYLITWLTDFSAMLLIFTISRDLAETGASLLKMGVVGGGVSLAHAISSVSFGGLSDRIGRRRIVFGGELFLLTSVVACALVPRDTLSCFIAYWGCGMAFGMIYPATIAWLNQGHEANHDPAGVSRRLVRFCLAWNLGLIAGQIAGGQLFPFGFHWPLVLAAALTVINLPVVLLVAGRSGERGRSSDGIREEHLRDQAVSAGFAQMNWIANLGGAFSMSMILHLFPKLAVSLGVPPAEHGRILGVMRVVVIAFYLLMHHSRFWHHRFVTSLLAQGAGACGLIILLVARGAMELIVGLTGVAALLGYNYFAGVYYSTLGGGVERRGFASGMHEGTLGVGFAAGAVGGGLAGTFGSERSPYFLGIVVIVVLAIIQMFVYIRKVRPLRHQTSAER